MPCPRFHVIVQFQNLDHGAIFTEQSVSPLVPSRPMDPELTTSGEVLLYTTEDGRTRVECRFEDDTIWLSQALIAELFQTSPQNVTLHLRNLYEEGEIREADTRKDYLQVRSEGDRQVRRSIKHYNLDAILAVGFRVRSARGAQFRRWASERLREYLVKGFVMDDERLRNPPVLGSGVPDYFDELLERIRDIRASERRMYLRVTEIFAMAADYVPSTPQTNAFFATMQNKLHFTVTGLTAAELIAQRANAASPNMGLTTWKGAAVAKGDVTTAKNYLREGEIGELNRIVVMWLDFADDQARRRKQVFLRDWEARLDDFLRFNDRDVLDSPGSLTKAEADEHARHEYERFAERRRRLLEAESERATLTALETTARRLTPGSRPR